MNVHDVPLGALFLDVIIGLLPRNMAHDSQSQPLPSWNLGLNNVLAESNMSIQGMRPNLG